MRIEPVGHARTRLVYHFYRPESVSVEDFEASVAYAALVSEEDQWIVPLIQENLDPLELKNGNGLQRREFQVRKSLNPLRCRQMAVLGPTITREWRWPGPFPFQDSQLLAEGKDFCVTRGAAKDDFAEDGDEDSDDFVHAGKGIRR